MASISLAITAAVLALSCALAGIAEAISTSEYGPD